MNDDLYFKQLLSGRDFAQNIPIAQQMANFCYLVGSKTTKEAIAIDPTYDVAAIETIAATDGMKIVGIAATHYHADHIGGSIMGHHIEGASAMLATCDVPVHIQKTENDFVLKTSGLTQTQLTLHDPSDVLSLGSVDISCIATPGHTPGSQCFLVDNILITGDTLFLDGCGRTDLPGGDPEQLYYSLTQKLMKISDDTLVYPGHNYGHKEHQSMGETRKLNRVFKPKNAQEWLKFFG